MICFQVFYIFCICDDHWLDHRQINLILKFKLLLIETPVSGVSWTFFHLFLYHQWANLKIVGFPHPPYPQPLFLSRWGENLNLHSVKIWRIDLIGVSRVLLLLPSFMPFSEDRKYYWNLGDIKWCIVHFVLQLVLKLQVKSS